MVTFVPDGVVTMFGEPEGRPVQRSSPLAKRFRFLGGRVDEHGNARFRFDLSFTAGNDFLNGGGLRVHIINGVGSQ